MMCACCCCEYLLVSGGHYGLRFLQLFVPPHVAPQPWHQLVVYQVVRLAAVHHHRERVAVGVKTPFAATIQQPCKRKSLVELFSKLRDSLTSSEGGPTLSKAEAI